MKKRLFSFLCVLLLSLTLVASLVSCSGGNGGESEKSVTEAEWRAAFNFENVSARAQMSADAVFTERTTALKFYGGKCHSSNDGVNFEACGTVSDNSFMFNFSENFSQFEFKDGSYVLKEGERVDITEGRLEYTEVSVKLLDDGKIKSIEITALRIEAVATITIEYSFEFSNYGTTDESTVLEI